ncbi:MAG: hypothetical protein SFV17_00160 [Candidatus Obscuribacter sp.]|nr:hypothetical protein [Candidatus Obscuribacter sp.]
MHKFNYLLSALMAVIFLQQGAGAADVAPEGGKALKSAFFREAKNEVDYPRLSKVAGYAIRVSVEKLDLPPSKSALNKAKTRQAMEKYLKEIGLKTTREMLTGRSTKLTLSVTKVGTAKVNAKAKSQKATHTLKVMLFAPPAPNWKFNTKAAIMSSEIPLKLSADKTDELTPILKEMALKISKQFFTARSGDYEKKQEAPAPKDSPVKRD